MKEIMEKIGKISFVSFEEIYNMRDKAREMYQSFDSDTKEVYKWYFYHQLCFMTNKKMCLKDCLWLYIAGKENIDKKLEEEYQKFAKIIQKRNKKYEKKPINQENYTFLEILGF